MNHEINKFLIEISIMNLRKETFFYFIFRSKNKNINF